MYLENVRSRLSQEERLFYPKISRINHETLLYDAPTILFAAIQSKHKMFFENGFENKKKQAY